MLNRVCQGYIQPANVTSYDWLACKTFPDWLIIWNQNRYLLQSAINPFILPFLTHNKTPEALMCANRAGWTWKLINRWHACYRSNPKLNARCADKCKQHQLNRWKLISRWRATLPNMTSDRNVFLSDFGNLSVTPNYLKAGDINRSTISPEI